MSNFLFHHSDGTFSSKLPFFLIICASMMIYSVYMATSIGKWNWKDTNGETTHQSQYEEPSKLFSIVNGTKIVLLITNKREYWGMRFSMGRIGIINAGCEVSNCILTDNHSFVPKYNFDAFMVHIPTARKGPWILPNRTSKQIFVLYSTEPPGKLKIYA